MTNEEIKVIIPDDRALFINLSDAILFNKYMKKLPVKGRLVEIGTGLGHSTIFFSLVKPKWTIYTIDGYGLFGEKSIYPYDPVDGKRTLSGVDVLSNMYKFREKGSDNVIQIIQDSSKIPWELPVDVIYIDGDHTYEGCKADFDRYTPFLKKGGCVFLDDYYREDFGVRQFVDEMCEKKWKMVVGTKAVVLERK